MQHSDIHQANKLLNDAVCFDLGNIGLTDPNIEDVESFNDPKSFITQTLNSKKRNTSPMNFDVEILNGTSMIPESNAQHSGLIQYVFNAWAKELGVVLKPDVLFYTIVSEIKNTIVSNPNVYRDLFTEAAEKTDIVITYLTIEKLMDVLKEKIPCRALFDVVSNTNFTTSPDNYSNVMAITLADMGTPYYNYGTSRCGSGIPKVAVCGNIEDWNTLKALTETLMSIFNFCKILNPYLFEVLSTIDNIIKAAFCDQNSDYFNKIFNYTKRPNCPSGHEPIILSGWVRNFYVGRYSLEYGRYGYYDLVNQFSSHLNCLPYDSRDTLPVEYFLYICGITSSRIINGFLYPDFNILHVKLNGPDSEEIFNILAKK